METATEWTSSTCLTRPNPKQLSCVQFAWRYYYGWPDTWRVKLAFPYAYLYHTHNGIFILDVSDPKAPKELAQIRIPRYPGQPGYRELSTVDKSGLRPVALPFDPTKVCYSPVCGLETVDGYMYFTGLFTDLHVYEHDTLVKATSHQARGPIELTAVGEFHDFTSLESLRLKGLKTYRPRGQVRAAVEQDGLVYVACGSAGIHVLGKDLSLLKQYPTAGFAMDVQICGDRLYAAQGTDGLVCDKLSGLLLEKAGSYAPGRVVKQVRLAPNGRYAVAHVGGSTYEVIDVSTPDDMTRVRLVRGWGGLVYYRQLCNGFIGGRYLCGTWCAGRTFMMDFGGDEPRELPDPPGFMPDMEAGGYCACGSYALVTRRGGYSFYKPLEDGEYPADLPVYQIEGGPAFRGKPTVRGNILVACDRIEAARSRQCVPYPPRIPFVAVSRTVFRGPVYLSEVNLRSETVRPSSSSSSSERARGRGRGQGRRKTKYLLTSRAANLSARGARPHRPVCLDARVQTE